MSKQSRRMQQQADTEYPTEQERAETQCACGTFRTPGQTHTKGDTGPEPKGLTAVQCNK